MYADGSSGLAVTALTAVMGPGGTSTPHYIDGTLVAPSRGEYPNHSGRSNVPSLIWDKMPFTYQRVPRTTHCTTPIVEILNPSMSTTIHPKRFAQNPVLPGELTDIIIDHLRHDVRALGVCGAVCSEWLIRSRYHIFSIVQLWPWRVRQFVKLAENRGCTFSNFITRIEMDDSRVRLAGKTSCNGGTKDAGGWHGRGRQEPKDEKNIMFTEAMAYSNLKCLTHVNTIQIRNVDWTTLSPTQQVSLRTQLSKFSQLRRLELHDVVFHDVREVARITQSFPSLHHLTANISFMKYLGYNLSLSATFNASRDLKSIELGTDEGIPVLLSCIANPERPHHIQTLKLRNLETKHLQYIRQTLRISGKHLQRLSLDFKHEKVSLVSEGRDMLPPLDRADHPATDDLDLSNLSDLRTLSVGGLQLNCYTVHDLIERTLPKILRRIEAPFFSILEVRFHMDAACSVENIKYVDWSLLQRVLLAQHFFGLSTVRIVVEVSSDSLTGLAQRMEREMRAGMGDLLVRLGGALDLRVACESAMGLEDGLVYDSNYDDKEPE